MPFPLTKKFVPENCFLLLPVQKPEIPSRIRKEAEQRGMVEKGEFHISVVVSKNAAKIKEVVSNSSDADNLKKNIATLFESLSWEYSFMDEYYLQENFYSQSELAVRGYPLDTVEHTRRIIVQKVSLPDLSTFYKQLSHVLEDELPIPVPHITLFSWSDNPSFMTRGIGVSSEEDFRTYSRGML